MTYIQQGIKMSSIARYKWGDATPEERKTAREAIQKAASNCRQWLKNSRWGKEEGKPND